MPKEISRRDRIIALQTLSACITEYRLYEVSCCLDALVSLRRDDLCDNSLPSPSIQVAVDSSGTGDSEFVIHDYEDQFERSADPHEAYAGGEFLPHPAYEICTPAARNIKVGDDPDQMSFLPFADDPAFDWEPYNKEYGSFAWQHFQLDPALEIIAIEAFQRLMLEGIRASAVDTMGLFPPRCRNPGALVTPTLARLGRLVHRRDFPLTLPAGWSPSTKFLPAYLNTGPSNILASLTNSFCHNPNCLTGYCSVHLGRIPPPLLQSPSKSPGLLAASVESPCGKDCFLVSTAQRDVHSVVAWSEADMELLQTVDGYSPNALPCDLATICRKPCSEVFKHRSQFLDPARQPKCDSIKRRKGANSKGGALKFGDHDAYAFKPKKPCSHPGPCDAISNCKCFKNSSHCSHNCRCGPKCVRQWKGCQCTSKSGQICDTKKCPCLLALRECDPRICQGCSFSRALGLPQPLKEPKAEEELGEGEPRKKKKDYVCGNMAIQLGLSKKTKVRRGRWGMGLYIMENARKGDLISEYIGELVYEPTTKSREYITRHLGRGYLFDLNKKMAVDSSLAGNEARYINHDEKNYNCHATIRNVQGEHRIGFFASKFIPKGSEILINYGSEFFKDKAVDSTQNPGWRVVSTMNETAITAAMRTPRGKAQSVGVPTNLQMMDDDDDWDLDAKEEEGEQPGLGCTRGEETPEVWEERRGGEVEEAQTVEEVEDPTSDASYQPPSLRSRSGSTSS